jgi:hypothetical protein
MVHALLALASAVNNLAAEHHWIAETASDLAEAKKEPGQRVRRVRNPPTRRALQM